MRQVKIFTVTQVTRDDVSPWVRAFASMEEARAMVKENASDVWFEATGGGAPCPALKENTMGLWLMASPDEELVQYIIREADLDLP